MSILNQLQEDLKVKCKFRFIYIGFNWKEKKWGKKWMEVSAIKGGGATFNGKCHWYFFWTLPLSVLPPKEWFQMCCCTLHSSIALLFFSLQWRTSKEHQQNKSIVLQNWYESHSIVTKRNQSNVFIIHECQNYLIANLSLPATIGWVALIFLVVCLSRNGYTSFFSLFVHPCHPITPSSQHLLWCSGPPTLLLCYEKQLTYYTQNYKYTRRTHQGFRTL